MRKLFCLFGLFVFSLSASAAGEWLYYKHYPWVYDNVSKDWLYLRGSSDGEVYAYRSSSSEWEVFKVQKTWEQKYDEWILNPEPYGGLEVLEQIKEAMFNKNFSIDLSNSNITDLSPLAELSSLIWLDVSNNNISDLSPLAELTNLTKIYLSNNNISDLSPIMNLPYLTEVFVRNNPIDSVQKLLIEASVPFGENPIFNF